MTTYSNTTNGKAVDERETDIAARADAPAQPGGAWLPATFLGTPVPGAMRVDSTMAASTYSFNGDLYQLVRGAADAPTGPTAGSTAMPAPNKAASPKRGGRPPYADDEWARQEIASGRPKMEVYREWATRPGVKERALENPLDSFKKLIKRPPGKNE